MLIFLNDIKIKLQNIKEPIKHSKYDVVFDDGKIKDLKSLKGKVLVVGDQTDHIKSLLVELQHTSTTPIKAITFLLKKPLDAYAAVLTEFKLIEAAGGIVEKGNRVLMIERLGNWDFPKGKLEKGENIEECALREVEEECNVKVRMKSPLAKTYHTYIHKNKNVIKLTHWYLMNILEDKKLIPQTEEGITKVEWIQKNKVDELLKDSYASLRHLYKTYKESTKI